jgi:hypothetical protein
MFEDIAGRVVASRRSDFSFKYGIARVDKILNGKTGQEYIFATELPAGRGGRDFELFSERVRLPRGRPLGPKDDQHEIICRKLHVQFVVLDAQ